MKTERESSEEVFGLLLDADRKLWDAVAAIHEAQSDLLTSFVPSLMQLRGDVHVKFLRPIYKKYPEIAAKLGLDEESEP